MKLYSKTHEWVEFSDDANARVGISDFAQMELGDLVFVNLPAVGDAVTAGKAFADVESVKAVSDVNSPVTGTITAINNELLDTPELINQDPYSSWFVEVGDITGRSELLSEADYKTFCEEGAH